MLFIFSDLHGFPFDPSFLTLVCKGLGAWKCGDPLRGVETHEDVKTLSVVDASQALVPHAPNDRFFLLFETDILNSGPGSVQCGKRTSIQREVQH